jgi:hypothetical protein
MNLKELKDFIGTLKTEYDHYELVNGEVGQITPEDMDSLYYRVDKPIIAFYVDDSSNEICFFHQTQSDVNSIMPKDNG